MKNIFGVICLLLVSFFTCSAQSKLTTRIFAECEVGTAAGLGYKLPYFNCGPRIEQPIKEHFELQFRGTYSPTDKLITNDGNTINLTGTGLVWVVPHKYGTTLDIGESILTTSKFKKRQIRVSPGVIFSYIWLDTAQRMKLDYLFPTGRYDHKTGIESSRLQGPEMTWYVQLTDRLQLVSHIAVYTGLQQGNQYCDGSIGHKQPGCSRTRYWTGASTVSLAWNFGHNTKQQAW